MLTMRYGSISDNAEQMKGDCSGSSSPNLLPKEGEEGETDDATTSHPSLPSGAMQRRDFRGFLSSSVVTMLLLMAMTGAYLVVVVSRDDAGRTFAADRSATPASVVDLEQSLSKQMPLLGTSESSSHKLTLSKRGQGVQPIRDDIPYFATASQDLYHPIDNAAGYLSMLVAENKLMWKEMAQKLEQVQAQNPLPEWIFNYGMPGGQADFVQAMARLFGKWIRRGPVDPQYVRTQAGAGTVLAMLSYLLGDDNDGVLISSPSYPVSETRHKQHGHE